MDVFTSREQIAKVYSDSYIPLIFKKLVKRTELDISKAVERILQDLDSRGFDSIVELTKKFDNFELTPENIKVTDQEIEKQSKKLTSEQKESVDKAFEQVYSFQKRIADKLISRVSGGEIEFIPKPISRVGIYVPGGLAPLPSSLMMAGATAKAAGVKEILVCTPPKEELNPAIAYLIKKMNVGEVYRIGGIQAIWAMTNGLPPYFTKVDKLCGPGNSYVTEAKKQLAMKGKVGVDLIAGPSEVLIIADESANPEFIAADVLAQAEHGPNSPGILITDSKKIAIETQQEIEKQLEKFKRKKEISIAIREYGGILLVKNIEEGIKLSDQYASEHLELFLSEQNLKRIKERIPSAGAVFIDTGEAFADYGFTGGNHILPTGRTARFSSGLSVLDFIVWQYVEELSKEKQEEIAEDVGNFADLEGLEAHANAARIRKR